MSVITETARIVAIRDGQMHLAALGGACASCNAASSCGTAKLSRLLPSEQRQLVIPAVPGKDVGDLVELELPEAAILGAAACAYLPPLVGMLAGILATAAAGSATQLAGGIVGASCGWIVSGLLTRRLGSRFRPALRIEK